MWKFGEIDWKSGDEGDVLIRNFDLRKIISQVLEKFSEILLVF